MFKCIKPFTAVFCVFLLGVAWTGRSEAGVATAGVSAQINSDNSAGSLIENPLPEEEITDPAPWVAVNFPTSPPVDPSTVVFQVDGVNRANEANIYNTGLYWQPPSRLKLGRHYISVTYQSVTMDEENNLVSKPQPPIEWSFTIVQQIRKTPQPTDKKGAVRAPVKPALKGKMTLTSAHTFVSAPDLKSAIAASKVQWPEGSLSMYDIRYQYKFGKKSLDGSISRSFQPLRLRSQDDFSMRLIDGPQTYRIGDLSITPRDFTPLTISGVKMRGIYYKRMFDDNEITYAYGRTQEPQDLRVKRMSHAFKWKAPLFRLKPKKDEVAVTVVKSNQITRNKGDENLESNILVSFSNLLRIHRGFEIEAETVYNDHEINNLGPDLVADLRATDPTKASSLESKLPLEGREFGVQVGSQYNYKDGLIELGHRYRNFGPRFTPTLTGAFNEKDREGNAYTLNVRPSQTLSARTSFDKYHNNIHHTDPLTTVTQVGRSTLVFTPKNLPSITHTYSKTYNDDEHSWNLRTVDGRIADFENTVKNVTYSYLLPDYGPFNRTMLSARVDDTKKTTRTRNQNSSSAGAVQFVDAYSQTDGTNWTFRTYYKGVWGLSYNTSASKLASFSANSINQPRSIDKLKSESEGKTNVDDFGLSYEIIPFVLSAQLNFRRQAQKVGSITYNGDQLNTDDFDEPYDPANPMGAIFDINKGTSTRASLSESRSIEKLFSTTLVWTIDQAKRLRFDYEMRDNYQAGTTGYAGFPQSDTAVGNNVYNERMLKLSLEKDF